jgi:lipoprotein-releasing system permease protein
MPYTLFIGLRYLRAKRRERFISLITVIATAGVAIGVMTLNVVLAVMTGFEEDLRDRILGFNAHVSIWSYLGPLQNPDDVAAKARAVPGVTTAEPFVYGQLMLTTPEHFAGVLVRGIPPSMAANPDLATRLRSGSIDQLDRRFAVPLQDGRGATVELPDGSALALRARELLGRARVAVLPPERAGLARARARAGCAGDARGAPEYGTGSILPRSKRAGSWKK